MIFLTGDTHIPLDIDKLNTKFFPEQKTMALTDYVIVLGDFGLLWKKDAQYEYWLRVLSARNFTFLFLDGNHENFDWLNSLPVEYFHGGKVHRIAKNILHLMRGEIFYLQGKTFFTFGGAASYDRPSRITGINWWPQEMPTFAEIDHGIQNLMRNENHVDYVLTHTCPSDLLPEIQKRVTRSWNPNMDHSLEDTFQVIERDLHYQGWFFGHWHMDFDKERYHALYRRVVRIV